MSDVCVVCGAPKKARNKHYCSKKCMGLGKQGYKICPVCGKIFKDPSRNMTVCCSHKCSTRHREALHAQGVYDDSIKKMRKGLSDFAEKLQPEEWWTAKGWVICSPSGQVYECRNLMNFIREHPDLFDGTPKQAFSGFTVIKATMQGKRPRSKSKSWKGWTLVGWSG